MATEADLRDLLRGPEPEGRAAIDVDAVIARARRRRRPRVVAAQALGSVGLVGALVVGVSLGVPPVNEASMLSAEDSGAGGPALPESATEADSMLRATDVCGEPLVEYPGLGWELEPESIDVTATGETARVTLRNDSGVVEAGTATVTSLAVVRDGIVVGFAVPAEPVAHVVDAPPGTSTTWEVPVTTQACASEAALPPGTYEVRVVAEFVRDDPAAPETLYGAPTDVELG